MLEFRHVGHAYNGAPSVEDISFTVNQGEVVTLLGPSGCGKTTLLRLAAGLERPMGGEIWLDDRLVSDATQVVAPETRGVGFMFQDYALFPHLSVLENVLFGLRDKGSAAMRRGLDVLAEANIESLADSYPHELSGGQQQRVALARALAPRPSVILLDEPYAGLDSRLRERIRDQMLHVLKAAGTAALMVTHDAEEAMFMSDNIIVMRHGQVQQTGRPVNLYCQPNTAFVAEFFGEVNRLEGHVSKGCIETILGSFDAPPTMSEGDAASIVIRHEGLIIEPDGTGENANAFVMEARLLGRASLIHLSVPTGTDELHFHARVPGLNSLQTGSPVRITVDATQAFVFPAGE
ncbi:MAG TPA: ABC transporter ATP-binding protein [Alphaproteobacteria bacterium]|jgi:iron(III) transport system ATP-binding protein|nr:ABC transporter ATP-binding protein [Alphaproteobacteria bacterium]|tara:strand:+ start:1781 stop:2827 length:1047 start_codon:yes stop_codon:yes gene_type:complete